MEVLEIIWETVQWLCMMICLFKMGAEPWEALIPIVNAWAFFRETLGSGWFVLLTLIPVVGIILSFIAYYTMFKGFGKSNGVAILLTIFFPIGILVCAFDGSTYCG